MEQEPSLYEKLLSTRDHSIYYPFIKDIITNGDPDIPTINQLKIGPKGVYLYHGKYSGSKEEYPLHLKPFGGRKSGTPIKTYGLLKRTCVKATVDKLELDVAVTRYDLLETTVDTKKRKTKEDGTHTKKTTMTNPSLIIMYGVKDALYTNEYIHTNENNNAAMTNELACTFLQQTQINLEQPCEVQVEPDLCNMSPNSLCNLVQQTLEETGITPSFAQAMYETTTPGELFDWVQQADVDNLSNVSPEKLVEARDAINRTLLHSCCYYGHVGVLGGLLQGVSDPQQRAIWVMSRNRHDLTALHTIVISKMVKPNQRVTLVEMIINGCSDLQQRSTLVNSLNRNVETALSIAQQGNMIDVIDCLQRHQALPLSELTVTLCISFPAKCQHSPITESFPKFFSVRQLLQNVLPKYVKEFYAKHKNHISKWKLKSEEGELFDGNTKISMFQDKQKLLIELDE